MRGGGGWKTHEERGYGNDSLLGRGRAHKVGGTLAPPACSSRAWSRKTGVIGSFPGSAETSRDTSDWSAAFLRTTTADIGLFSSSITRRCARPEDATGSPRLWRFLPRLRTCNPCSPRGVGEGGGKIFPKHPGTSGPTKAASSKHARHASRPRRGGISFVQGLASAERGLAWAGARRRYIRSQGLDGGDPRQHTTHFLSGRFARARCLARARSALDRKV